MKRPHRRPAPPAVTLRDSQIRDCVGADDAEGNRVQSREGWRCPSCGLTRGPDHHDPCIANLPGVAYGCCGHGGFGDCPGYIKFTDGRVVRFHYLEVDGTDHNTLY